MPHRQMTQRLRNKKTRQFILQGYELRRGRARGGIKVNKSAKWLMKVFQELACFSF